jgi:hypothetical protein
VHRNFLFHLHFEIIRIEMRFCHLMKNTADFTLFELNYSEIDGAIREFGVAYSGRLTENYLKK